MNPDLYENTVFGTQLRPFEEQSVEKLDLFQEPNFYPGVNTLTPYTGTLNDFGFKTVQTKN